MGSQIGALFGGLFGDAGQNFAGLQGGASKVFGSKPKVADFTALNLTEEQKKALQGNLSNADAMETLLNRLIPGWSANLAQAQKNNTSLLQGQIPQDVQDKILRNSAYQSFAGGFGGSGMSHALTARDLGLTSLDLQQQGNNSAQQWAKLAENTYSPLIIDTAQQAQATAANNAGRQANQQYKYNVAAAPDPGAAGVFNLDTALGMQALSFGMGSLGGIGGGGGTPNPSSGGGMPSNYYNYAGQQGGVAYQYNPTSNSYIPIQRATQWGG